MLGGETHLVLGHLEWVSREIFEKFRNEITVIVGGQNGIYALYADGRLYYVGLARDLRSRLKTHLNDRHKDGWDHFSAYLTNGDGHMREMESLMLRIIKPKGNRVMGRLKGSTDLKRELERRVRLEQERVIGGLLGRLERVKKEKHATSRKDGALQAHGITGVVVLKAIYKGKEYRATLQTDGSVKLRGKTYGSLSGAGKSITQRATNGRYFWQVRNASNEWVRLHSVQ